MMLLHDSGSDFNYSELRLARVLRLHPDDLALLRNQHLQESIDWNRERGQSDTHLTARAVYRIVACVSNPPASFKLSSCRSHASRRAVRPAMPRNRSRLTLFTSALVNGNAQRFSI